MPDIDTYRVVGVRPDGTVGVTLYSNTRSKARMFASFVPWRNDDGTVRIEAPPDDTKTDIPASGPNPPIPR